MLRLSRLGLGAPLPQDAHDSSRQHSSNDTLRKILLGKTSQKLKSPSHIPTNTKITSHTPFRGLSNVEIEDEDEEGGRSALGKGKRRRLEGREATNLGGEDQQSQEAALNKPGKASSSYLDQVLSERSRKRRKSKRPTNSLPP
jgi:hypothetical protein